MRTTLRRSYAYALGALAALAALLSFGNASAATFSIVGGSSYVLPSGAGGFNPAGSVSTLATMSSEGVLAGATITTFSSFGTGKGLFVSPQSLQLTFTFMGKEAGDTNGVQDSLQLISFDTPVLNLPANFGQSISGTYDVGSNPGLVPIKFFDINAFAQIINGGFASSNTAIGFLITSDPSVAYAFFDDPNRRHPDGDFDDMIVRIQAVGGETPLPGALPLFVSGLAALGLVRWRRRRKLA